MRPLTPSAILLVAGAACRSIAREGASVDGSVGSAFRGHYTSGFEVSSFRLCDSSEDWWLIPPDDSARAAAFVDRVSRAARGGPSTPGVPPGYQYVYLEVRGDTTEQGQYGHLERYVREFRVKDVVAVRPSEPGDCPEREAR